MRTLDLSSEKRVQMLLFLTLLLFQIQNAKAVTICCPQKPRSCTLYELLCRTGQSDDSDALGKIGHLTSDTSVGILTLGKRKASDNRYHERLQNLLQSSRNQAAGILTMGKRDEDEFSTFHTPVKLDLERPLKYII